MIIKDFTMSFENYGKIKCSAPCSMYSVLLEQKLIPDPFYGLNELELTKLSEKDCEFEAVFEVDNEILDRDYVELNFSGLDTICEIYLNGAFLDKTMNMHRIFNYNVKSLLKSGQNTLKLMFRSPLKYITEMNHRHYMPTNQDAIPGASHLRKPTCMFGWDWGPKLPDMGISGPVEIFSYDVDKIEDFEVLQYHKDGKVDLEIIVDTKHCENVDIFAEIDGKKVKLTDGKADITIDNPKLWWVRGYGEQHLYDLKITLEKDGKVIDKLNKKIGLRTVDISREKDKYGREFVFVVNGVKIFAMGGNYIPDDCIISRITDDVIKRSVDAAIFANHNCIRVWGGGYYPRDFFYEYCDECGMLVWQDFMVACSAIWLTEDMKENFMEEVICNMKRFRHHACIGLICGNNECEESIHIKGWGDNMQYATEYIELYENLLAKAALDYMPQTFYWPSSPSSGGGFDRTRAEDDGDSHYWEVWHGGVPFTEYRKHMFRFCSEYGFESFPSMKTINSFCEEKDQNAFSRVMENHQKCLSGNQKILTYLSANYLYPQKFEDLVYASQLLQGEAIKYGVEYFRKIRECCKGSIYWQSNDCWPVASWSSVDYYGRYKALHYMAKKFYAPVLMIIYREDEKVSINIINETMKKFKGKVKFNICKNDFTVLETKEFDVDVDSLISDEVYKFDMVLDNPYNTYCYADFYDENGNFIMRQTEIVVPAKHYEWEKPDVKVSIKKDSNKAEFSFTSNCFTKSVYVDFEKEDIILSDNYFDITNDKPYVITAETDLSVEELTKQLQIKTVYDIR